MSRVEVPAALERGTRTEKAASRKMAARGDGADLIAVGERESSGVATGPAGTGGDAQREMERYTDSTSLLGSS